MQTRHEDGPLDGLLEFPGGKVEAGESFKEAAIREFIEETGVALKDKTKVVAFKNYSYEYPDRSVTLFTFIGQMKGEELSSEGWRVINFSDPLKGIEEKILSANHTVIRDLSGYFQEIVEDESWSELWPPL